MYTHAELPNYHISSINGRPRIEAADDTTW